MLGRVKQPVRARTLMVLVLYNCRKYKDVTKNIPTLGSQFDLRHIKIVLKPIRARTLMVRLLFLTVDWPTANRAVAMRRNISV